MKGLRLIGLGRCIIMGVNRLSLQLGNRIGSLIVAESKRGNLHV